MSQIYTDDDFAQPSQSPQIFNESDFKDAPAEAIPSAQSSPQATTFMQGLTTNLPTNGFTALVGRLVPQTIGGLAGSLAGSGIASIPGAAAGGATGEAIRQDLVSLTQGQNSPQSVLANVGGAALGQGAGQGLNVGLGALLGSKGVLTAGAQAMRAMDATPENIASAAISNPSLIKQGMEVAANDLASKGYQAFQQQTGLQGLDDLAGARGKPWSANELYELATTTANKVKAGEAVSNQDLFAASQAQNALNRMAAFNNPDALNVKGTRSLIQAGKTVDEALEKNFPEYQTLRQNRFLQAIGDNFNSFFPKNKNGSVNSLRTFASLGYALKQMGESALKVGTAGGALGGLVGGDRQGTEVGALGGAALGLFAPLAISPYMAGLALRAGGGAVQAQIPQTLVRTGASALTNYIANPSQDSTPRFPQTPQGLDRKIAALNNPWQQ